MSETLGSGYGYSFPFDHLRIGERTDLMGGNVDIDYIRFEPRACWPAEPNSIVMLLGLAGVAFIARIVRRRRK